jgi:hypothetical protein
VETDIKEILFEKEGFFELSINEKICGISYLHTFFSHDETFTPQDIKKIFESLRDEIPTNIPSRINILSRPKSKKMIHIGKGKYRLFTLEEKKWENYFSLKNDTKKIKLKNDLQFLTEKIKSDESREFLEEAVSCLNVGAKRAAIVMTWILTIDTLQEYIFTRKNKLDDFNKEWLKTNNKNKSITNIKEFSDIKEERFIELCRASGIIDNNERKILDVKLGIRNTASHPNKIKIKDSKVIDFIEDLIENILNKFS